ncbi:MAG: glycosyltransferase family 2 protein [Cyanothece sp. SIO1E1]|nr:glycosyltransferase family 2 protein [Cyanothece sp. SIO1E1]
MSDHIVDVSVVIPLHNKEAYIAETIQSVLAQDISSWELIIIENGSTDRGPDIVKNFLDSRIHFYESRSCGPGVARNFGLNKACGDWVLFLDADDLIEPDHLSSLLKVVKEVPTAGIIAGGWKQITNAILEAEEHHPIFAGCGHEELLARALALAPWVVHAAILKRSIFENSYCHWPEELDSYPDEDTAFWFSVLTKAKVAWSAQSGAIYRLNTDNNRSQSGDCYSRLIGYLKILQHNLELAHRLKIHLPKVSAWYITSMLEVNYRKALEINDGSAAALALEAATDWLQRCPSLSVNVHLRKLFGLKRFNYIRRFISA